MGPGKFDGECLQAITNGKIEKQRISGFKVVLAFLKSEKREKCNCIQMTRAKVKQRG